MARPSVDEVRAATSDVECKNSTGLVEIALRTRATIEQRLVEELNLFEDVRIVSENFGLQDD